ncbi:MAG: MarR family winged helix-turn-helix transcriptional regulator [Candidatus Binatia bacterium]
MRVAVQKNQVVSEPAAEFLEFFYPIHYKLGMAIEDALRGGQLTRKQVAILWLIRAEGSAQGMRRKEIERLITTWFEVSSSAITKALRSMARSPLNLVQVVEDPHSGREKQVILTAKGQRFLSTMFEQGTQFVRDIAEQLTEEEVRTGIHFLSKVTVALEHLRAARAASNGKRQ